MSIKSLASLVLLLVAGILASVRSYLEADRALASQMPVNACECCDMESEDCCPPAGCTESDASLQVPRDGRGSIYRSSLAVRRREASSQMPRDS